MKVTAKVTRSGAWWAVEVPDVADGIHTQSRTLAGVPAMVADAVSLVQDVPAEDVEVEVQYALPEAVTADLELAAALREQAAKANHDAAVATRHAAGWLAHEGLSVRDIGAVLGVSYQRAHQLISD